ncbi:polysaccharide deacetylase family protein [Pseudodonghicola flavimaris]|uniref:Chitooligosaccharide deacetylase n=1 Tax=Pseudodonghicola flavimaris TaxID=3050036 RepID=A0ABT7F3B6_9RHOB|nr:polysaccharide deacetylase family protein [Pseudodonghicola flavimaris]MDK3019093.1 polysaccharide deacetylase family protein [Pseudodonghicola flavimaris]
MSRSAPQSAVSRPRRGWAAGMSRPVTILTVDLEDWFHVLDNEATRGEVQWRRFATRLPEATAALLAQFSRHGVQATFFVLGWVAARYPEVVATVAGEGHEIACHSDMHQLVYEQTPQAFRADLAAAVKHIEAATGIRPTAYRAPGFSITRATPWAFDVLADLGFDTDCSIFPAPRAHGGFAGYGAGGPAMLRTPSGRRLRELPINYARVLGQPLVYGGGGYFRLVPGAVGRWLVRRQAYNMTYFHLRDFDSGQPMIPGLSRVRRFKSYVGIRGAAAKLDRLLDSGEVMTLGAAAATIDWDRVRIVDLAEGQAR